MGLPEEDRGPAWLRDWGRDTGHTDLDTFTGYVDPNALSVDINTLVAFAQALQVEQEKDFRPHVQEVFKQMSAITAPPDGRFIELTEGLTHHREMLALTSTAIAQHDKAIVAFVEAARTISTAYRNVDAMSAATVADVENSLTNVSVTAQSNPDTVITPQQAAQQTSAPITTGDGNTSTTDSPDGGQEIPSV